jgi:aspartyl-tRNA(Asn)/glutamyl-tRNA(Gln) amidotransferase subunit A
VAEIGEDVLFAGAAALSRRIRAGELSPLELARAFLARIEAQAPRLGCFVTVTAERALADARRAESEIAAGRWRGPLHGIPVGLEDVIDTKGIRTTFGAKPYAGRVPERDATVAARLSEAGAVLAGKLSTIELAGGLGYTTPAAALDGPCRNPWDPRRWAGGSSSGPAAAVAAGLVPLAIGMETRGSITCPAAFCGVTGYRPTYGVLSRHGAMTLAYTLGKLGPLSRSAEDCALATAVLAGADARDPSAIAPPPGLDRVRAGVARGLRIAVLELPAAKDLLAGAREAFEAAQGVFREAGAIVDPAELPPFPHDEVAEVLVEAEAANAFEDLVRSGRTRELADPSHRTRSAADYVPRATSADYVRASRIRAEIQRAMARFFEKHDLVLAPNLPFAPPRVDEALTSAPWWGAPDPIGAAGNLAGLPAVAFPVGLAGGLPVSAQLVGPALEDARVLGAAALFQSRTSHHLQRPPRAGPAVAAAAPHRGPGSGAP